MPKQNPEFWKRCATLTDFEICDRTSLAIYHLPEDTRSWPQVVVDRLWSFQGFTQGEGLAASASSCFFEEISLAAIAEAYDVIGLPAHAEVAWKLSAIIEEANDADKAHGGEISLFQDTDDFVAFVSTRLDLDGSEDVIFDRGAGFTERLAQFIRGNLREFENLEFDLSPPHRDPPNIGYLSSMLSWVRSYANKHNMIIPTLPQLIDHCMHEGIKRLTSATHTILVEGRLPEDRTERLIRYHRKGARNVYVVTVGGTIIQEPTGD